MQVIRMMMVYLEGDRVRRAMPSGVFKTADGWLQFLVVRDQQWVALVRRAGNARSGRRSALRRRRRDASHNEAELMGIVRPAIAEKPTAYWSERLREADIMHERLNSFREFVAQPQAEATDLISWLQPRRCARARSGAQCRRHRAVRRTARRAPSRRFPASTPARSWRTTASAPRT